MFCSGFQSEQEAFLDDYAFGSHGYRHLIRVIDTEDA